MLLIKLLIWATYRRLPERKVDLRIVHIAGRRNVVADKLSWLNPHLLRIKYWHLNLFSPPNWAREGTSE